MHVVRLDLSCQLPLKSTPVQARFFKKEEGEVGNRCPLARWDVGRSLGGRVRCRCVPGLTPGSAHGTAIVALAGKGSKASKPLKRPPPRSRGSSAGAMRWSKKGGDAKRRQRSSGPLVFSIPSRMERNDTGVQRAGKCDPNGSFRSRPAEFGVPAGRIQASTRVPATL